MYNEKKLERKLKEYCIKHEIFINYGYRIFNEYIVILAENGRDIYIPITEIA